jgi:hypothetical protein
MSTPSAILQRGTWSHAMVSRDFRRSPIYSKQVCSTFLFIEFFDTRYRGTHASRSVTLLRSTYRWMLTGTPVTNTLYALFFAALLGYQTTSSADIYGLIRFGRFRPWNDWESFKQYIVRSFAFWTFSFSSSFRQRCSKRMRRLRVSKPLVLIQFLGSIKQQCERRKF